MHDNRLKSINNKHWTEAISLALIALLFFFVLLNTFQHLIIYLAYHGWSIQNLVNHYFHPKLFSNSFPSGQSANLTSLNLNFFILVAHLLGSGHYLDYVNVTINLGCYFALTYCLLKIFSRKISPSLLLFTLTILLFSNARESALGNFGAISLIGQAPYALAYLFLCVALWLIIEDHLIFAAIFFALAVMTHPILGLLACLFAIGCKLPQLRALNYKKALIGALIFIALTGGWLFYHFPPTPKQLVPTSAWLSLTKIFNYHWYPVNNGFFSYNSAKKILPFTGFLLLLIHYLLTTTLDSKLKQQLVSGFLTLLIVSLLGVLLSLSSNTMLITLAFQRASSIMLLVGTAFICIGFWQDLRAGNTLSQVIISLIILTFFFSKSGYPLILCGLLLLSVKLSKTKVYYRIAVSGVIVIACLYLILLNLYKVPPLQLPSLSGYLDINQLPMQLAWLIKHSPIDMFFSHHYVARPTLVLTHVSVLVAAVLLLITLGIALFTQYRFFRFLFVVLTTFFSVIFLSHQTKIMLPAKKASLYQSFFQVQLWAKQYTKQKSLFMIPPNQSYGWTDYSQRPSIGNPDLWLQTSWMYLRNKSTYQFGLALFHEYNIPLTPFVRYKSLQGSEALRKLVSTCYYSESAQWFKGVQEKYGVSYFVFQKQHITNPVILSACHQAYQNQYYLVCQF